MFHKRLRKESGYSLVEVMASIVILTIAILPMAAMFDMGLRSATAGSNLDKARALANLKLEEAKSLPFDSTDAAIQDVNDNFPEAADAPPTTYDASGSYESAWKPVTGPASADFTNFRYKVRKQYIAQPVCQTPSCPPADFTPSPSATSLIRVTVIVGWGTFSSGTYSKTFTTYGLVTG